jgi:hypothetical protein
MKFNKVSPSEESLGHHDMGRAFWPSYEMASLDKCMYVYGSIIGK